MKTFTKLVSKYAILLTLSYLLNTWFIFWLIVQPKSLAELNVWESINSYSGYFFQIITAILLFIDTKRYELKFYLIPIAGLFYPLLGISVFLIVFIYKEYEVFVSNSNLEQSS